MATPIPYPEFLDRVLMMYRAPLRAPKTYTKMSLALREFGQLPGVSTTLDLDTSHVARFQATRADGNVNTTLSLLRTLRTASRIAVEEGWLDRPPQWRRLMPREIPGARNAPRPYGELARLLQDLAARRDSSWTQHRLCAVVWTIALTGIRRNEALFLRLEDVQLGESPLLRIDPAAQPLARLKTPRSERRVPIPAVLAELLARWVPLAGPVWLFPGVKRLGPWVSGSAAGRPLGALQTAALRVGIPHITWHSLRHSFGTTAVGKWQVPLWVVQRLLGHTSVRTTERYLHLDSVPEIAAAVRGIAYRLAD